MCRYAFNTYKNKYACFDCRKAFKLPHAGDWFKVQGLGYVYEKLRFSTGETLKELEVELGHTLDELEKLYSEAQRNCPECKQPMADMGKDFKAPKQSDLKSWDIFKGMYTSGRCFLTCGCNGPGMIPSSRYEYRQYLENMIELYTSYFSDFDYSIYANPEQQKIEIRRYWSERIALINEALAFAR